MPQLYSLTGHATMRKKRGRWASLQRPDVDVPQTDGPMVALNHQRIQRRLWDLERGPGGSRSRDIAMDDHAIVLDSDKAGVFGLLPGRVKPGSAEPDVERLPLARRATGVLERRRASHSFAVDPTLINRAAVVYTRFLHAVAVQNLNLIEAVQVDAGIRLGGDAEFQV